MNETKERLIDTAERLIAENGYAATSLRQIIGEAGVNLAAVHYHFGSKEELLDAVVMRHAEPVNRERLALLDRYEAEARGRAVPVARIFEALLMPIAAAASNNSPIVRVMGRIVAEGLLDAVIHKNFGEVFQRFGAALRKATPFLSEEEFRWRMVFMEGALARGMTGKPAGDFEKRLTILNRFLTGAFEAPGAEGKK